MATIWKEVTVELPVDEVWAAVRDVGHAHERLFVGVLSAVQFEQGVRTVTFTNGQVFREPIVSIDDAHRRVAWTVDGGSLAHHNASLQVLPAGDGQSTIVWITDILPDAAEPAIRAVIEGGAAAMRAALSRKQA